MKIFGVSLVLGSWMLLEVMRGCSMQSTSLTTGVFGLVIPLLMLGAGLSIIIESPWPRVWKPWTWFSRRRADV